MALPAGFSSDEDDLDGFLSDRSDDAKTVSLIPQSPPKFTKAQIINKLFYAVTNGNLEEIQSFLDDGFNINERLKDGWTLLMLAASVGNLKLTREFIKEGADVNADKDKFTVLMAACNCPESTAPASECFEIVTLLLEKKVNVDAVTYRRKSALMFAAYTGNILIVEKLLTLCNIHAEDNQGWNALGWAVNGNKPKIVELLLKEGLNANKADIRGNKPVDYAKLEDYVEIVDMLSEEDDCDMITIPEICYDLEILNNQPQFSQDVQRILYGINCEYMTKKFKDVDLQSFLCITDEELVKLGVEAPYQRKKILSSLHTFHRHPFKQKSFNIVPNNLVYSNVDLLNNLITIIRQLIAMKSSIKYIRNNKALTTEELQKLGTCLKNLKKKVRRMKRTALALSSLSKEWDSEVYIPDTPKRSSNIIKLAKIMACAGTIFTIFVIIRKI